MELQLVRDETDAILAEVAAAEGVRLSIPVGKMMELPRAAVSARQPICERGWLGQEGGGTRFQR